MLDYRIEMSLKRYIYVGESRARQGQSFYVDLSQRREVCLLRKNRFDLKADMKESAISKE